MITKDKIKDTFKNILSVQTSTSKELFYLFNFLRYTIPQGLYKKRLNKLLNVSNTEERNYLIDRVNYYNKLQEKVALRNATAIKDFKFRHEFSTYYFDTYELTRYFPLDLKFRYEFGDIVDIPEQPAFLKSRPIHGNNENSVLLKLNKVRHYGYVNDGLKYEDKKDLLVWRGNVTDNKTKRVRFFEAHFNNPLCDIGVTWRKYRIKVWLKEKMTLRQQLEYKFILSLEGHDVATNLKWVMSSNSVAVMPEPEFETWFMEGRLIPNYHYICIKKDYSDLNEKINYYLNNKEEALKIIKNANEYVNQFKNKKREKIISLMVLKKYFDFTI